MSSETLGRVFEPFFTTKEVGKGSGLGLGASLWFCAQRGRRCRDRLEAGRWDDGEPLFSPLVRRRQRGGPSDAGEMPLRRAASGETVLLVEDDEQVLDMAIESLEELHYKVIVARNAREALEHLKGPSASTSLFSDVVMPGGMNGAQLAARRGTSVRAQGIADLWLCSGEAADHGIGLTCRFSISRIAGMSWRALCASFWAEAPAISSRDRWSPARQPVAKRLTERAPAGPFRGCRTRSRSGPGTGARQELPSPPRRLLLMRAGCGQQMSSQLALRRPFTPPRRPGSNRLLLMMNCRIKTTHNP